MQPKLKPINGWTKAKMLKCIEKYVPDTKEGCRIEDRCLYQHPSDENCRCAVGAMLNGEALQYASVYAGTVLSLTRDFPEIEKEMPLPREYMRILQGVHDSARSQKGNTTARQACIDWINNKVEDDE